MPSSLGGVLSYLRRLSPDGPADEDGPLLSRFVQGDGAAFTALVGRHAPLVWGVCRRLLGPSPDAEDAFQATFVVLVQKAASLADGRPLGPWLHKVASRTATKARARSAKRRARETAAEVEVAREDAAVASQREVGAILEEELGRLPEHYRRPVVLCYLEGLTNEEAARRLDCPKGTILSRLSRARERLRERLERRGLDPAMALPVALAAEAAPAALVEAVAQAGPLLRVGADVGLSSSVMTLAKGVVIGMVLRKVEVAGVVVLAMAMMAGGAGWLGHRPQSSLVPSAMAGPDETAGKKPEGARTATEPKRDKEVEANPRFVEVAALMNKIVDFAGVDDPKETLGEILDKLSKLYRLNIEVNEKAIKAEAPGVDILAGRIAETPLSPAKTTLHRVLNRILVRTQVPSGLVCLVRRDHIEITTGQAACEELNVRPDQLKKLVHYDFRQTDLGEALSKLMEDSDANIVFDPKLDAKTGGKTQVTARLMNVPIETALKLLANMANMAVVKLDNVYYVTTPDNAEKLEAAKPKDRRAPKPDPAG